MGGSQVESGVSIYRVIESRKKVQDEGEDENVVGIREMKRESEEYKSNSNVIQRLLRRIRGWRRQGKRIWFAKSNSKSNK